MIVTKGEKESKDQLTLKRHELPLTVAGYIPLVSLVFTAPSLSPSLSLSLSLSLSPLFYFISLNFFFVFIFYFLFFILISSLVFYFH